jgi:putative ABC transport system ATP-binding protein
LIIKLSGINKSFQTGDISTRALRDIDLSIAAGEYVAIEGPSGCGKSTLLSMLGLLDTPDSGDYTLLGKSTSTLSEALRSATRNGSIGFIFQNFNLIGDLTVAENVELPLKYRGVAGGARRRRVAEVLEQVGLMHRARHFPPTLSGGQQQRVAVARAVVNAPPILLADEPTGNLDSQNGEAVMQLIAELNKTGSTVVMVSHDPRFIKYADRTIGLLDGALCEPVSVAALR